MNVIQILLLTQGGVVGNAPLLCMIISCILFAISIPRWVAPPPPAANPWWDRAFPAAFFFWTLAIVIQMFGGL